MLFFKEFNPTGNKTVVFLHGLGAHSDSWEYQWDVFANAGYRVIVPDFTGFGRSPYVRGRISVKTLADDLYNLFKKINVQRAHFVGLSLGGAVAMQFALDHPVIVEKLVLSNTSARFFAKGKMRYFMVRFISSKLLPRKTLARAMAGYTFPKPEQQEWRDAFVKQILESNRKGYMRLAKSFIKYDLTEEIQRIKAPTLIIGGEEDRTLPLHMQEYIHSKIKNSQMVIFPGGHVSSVDSAEDFNREVLAFLGENAL